MLPEIVGKDLKDALVPIGKLGGQGIAAVGTSRVAMAISRSSLPGTIQFLRY